MFLPKMLQLLVLIALLGADAAAQAPAVRQSELHGGIEIAPRIVRGIVVRISNGDEGYNVKLLYSVSDAPAASPQLKDGKYTQEYIRAVSTVVERLFQTLQQQHQVPTQQVHIIGLADLAASNLDELGNEILNRTGRPTNFIDAVTDTELSIAGIIPRRYSVGNKVFDNRGISMLLDVTNSNLRGGYQQIKRRATGAAEYEFVTWEAPKGVLTFAGEVARAAGDSATLAVFANRAQIMATTTIRPLIQNELARRPAMQGRKKIYLTGSIVWAMMTLLHPGQADSYLEVTMNDINTFYNRALLDPESLMNPDLSKITDENMRDEMRRARESIKAAFPPKSLLAGAEMLRTLAQELQFQNKRVLFPRFSWFARILSYVRLEGQ